MRKDIFTEEEYVFADEEKGEEGRKKTTENENLHGVNSLL